MDTKAGEFVQTHLETLFISRQRERMAISRCVLLKTSGGSEKRRVGKD